MALGCTLPLRSKMLLRPNLRLNTTGGRLCGERGMGGVVEPAVRLTTAAGSDKLLVRMF
jgi:hypothetical protein